MSCSHPSSCEGVEGGGGEPEDICASSNESSTGAVSMEEGDKAAPANKLEDEEESVIENSEAEEVRVQEAQASSSTEKAHSSSENDREMETVTEDSSSKSAKDESLFRKSSRRRNSNRVYRNRTSGGRESSGEEEEAQVGDTWVDAERYFDSSSSSTSSSSMHSMFESPDLDTLDDKDPASRPRVLAKPRPRHKWFVMQEVINRQIGVGSRWQGSELFQQRCYGSLHAVQRLELMYKLEAHKGCVNTLNFNQSGSLLASASDDRKVALWDWALGKCVFTYDSGHTSNVFQAKFLPLSGDRHIVSSARDGQVRLAVLSGTGVCRSTRHLAQHKRPANKIATHPETPHVFLSTGEDAVVMSLDVREHCPNKKLMFVKEGLKKIALYSIHSNPINCQEFCIAGDDHFIRLYDKRKISFDGVPMKRFCPRHLEKTETFIHVTCAVFNYNGTEVLGSYNDEDIYLFDTRHSDGADYIHRYGGHRNSVTVKGVNFFGPRSEYVVSGSDCGNIYFWDKHTESIVQWMRGDEEGVVNVLEPHPQVPMLATSGLDYDIKIWVPSCEQEPTFKGLNSAVEFNHKARTDMRNRSYDPWDSQMQWLWRQIRRFERHRGTDTSEPELTPETWLLRGRQERSSAGGDVATPQVEVSDDSSTSSDEEEPAVRPECSPS